MQSKNFNEKSAEKTYPKRAHWALVKLLWQNFQKLKGCRQSHLRSMCINLSWMQRKKGGWKWQRRQCCWEGRFNHEEGYESTVWKIVLKSIEFNNEIRVNVDDQQDDKKIKVTIRHRWCRWSSGYHRCQNPHEKEKACVCDM